MIIYIYFTGYTCLGPFHTCCPIWSACQFFRKTWSDAPFTPMGYQRWHVHWHPPLSDPILSGNSRRMVTLFFIHLADRIGCDQMKTNRRSIFNRSPHRGERDSDRSISAQWAETELSSSCSAGISASIPCWAKRSPRADHLCERTLTLMAHQMILWYVQWAVHDHPS